MVKCNYISMLLHVPYHIAEISFYLPYLLQEMATFTKTHWQIYCTLSLKLLLDRGRWQLYKWPVAWRLHIITGTNVNSRQHCPIYLKAMLPKCSWKQSIRCVSKIYILNNIPMGQRCTLKSTMQMQETIAKGYRHTNRFESKPGIDYITLRIFHHKRSLCFPVP